MMKVFKTIDAIRQWSYQIHLNQKSIALVPTMGYLHEGHLSLVRKARAISENVVVSIFVNPTQFAPGEDFDKYPVDLQRDLKLLEKEKVDVVFMPEKNEMYADDFQTYVENREISQKLCGVTRPTHFRGVTTVVAKLFNIIDPDYAVFGRKDAQQAIIIKTMVRDLNFNTEIIIEPIMREADGLAMSSRNKYLTAVQRKNAIVLSQCLQYAQTEFESGNKNITNIKQEIKNRISNIEDCRVDYVEFVNAINLQDDIQKGDKVLLALAVFVGTTRLIDNIILNY